MVARLCYMYKWRMSDVLRLTFRQALMFDRYGVEIVTGEDPAKADTPDRAAFHNRLSKQYGAS